MERLCHVFRIAPGTEDEYVRRHVEIWPEIVEAMKAAGFANYTLFRRGLEVIAYCECEPDVETCFARFADHVLSGDVRLQPDVRVATGETPASGCSRTPRAGFQQPQATGLDKHCLTNA